MVLCSTVWLSVTSTPSPPHSAAPSPILCIASKSLDRIRTEPSPSMPHSAWARADVARRAATATAMVLVWVMCSSLMLSVRRDSAPIVPGGEPTLAELLAVREHGCKSFRNTVARSPGAAILAAGTGALARGESSGRGDPRGPRGCPVPHRTFFLFILPSIAVMMLFIALPIVSVAYQSLFVEHEQVLVTDRVLRAVRLHEEGSGRRRGHGRAARGDAHGPLQRPGHLPRRAPPRRGRDRRHLARGRRAGRLRGPHHEPAPLQGARLHPRLHLRGHPGGDRAGPLHRHGRQRHPQADQGAGDLLLAACP